MKLRRSIDNLVSGFIAQFLPLILGFLVPSITIRNYGSEINGFISLVNQLYAYIGLLEAGLGTSIIQALYNPITRNDKNEISGIISAAKDYYKKIAVLYTVVVIILSIFLPFFLKIKLTKAEVALYFFLFGISNIINFWATAYMKPILVAEGKNFVSSNISTIFNFVLQFVRLFLLYVGVNIILLQFVYSIINILQVLVYYVYFKINYKWVDLKVTALKNKIKQRGSFFIQQINQLIFSCTDVVVISFFCNLKVASVYAVYMLIYNAVSIFMSTFSSSTQFILGQSYHENNSDYLNIHRSYEIVIITLGMIIYTTSAILAIPFISIYTRGITDVKYIYVFLPVFLSLNGILATFKSVPLCLINFTYNLKKDIKHAIIESVLNLSISIILVNYIGMLGVLIGTTIALIYRLICFIILTNKNILKTSNIFSIKLYSINLIVYFLIIFFNNFLLLKINSYFDFIIHGIIITLLMTVLFGLLNIVCNIKQFKFIKNTLLAILKREHK